MVKPLSRLANVLSVSLAIQTGTGFLVLLPTDSLFGPSTSDPDNAVAAIVTVLAYAGVLGIGLVAALVSAVLFLVWMFRAAMNLRFFEPNVTFQFTPALCVVWWFVPIAHLVQPYRAMKEIWSHTWADAEAGRAAPLLGFWWAIWLVSNAGDRVAMALDSNIWIGFVSSVLDAVAAIACALVVRQISTAQDERARTSTTDVLRASGITPAAG
jgi:hypothetical protein